MITQKLIDYIKPLCGQKIIADIVIGIGYTVVVLDDNSCGTAFTFRSELGPKCGQVEHAGKLIGEKACDAIDWAMSINLACSAIGVAVMNAIMSRLTKDYIVGDAIDNLDIRDGDVCGMIGYYKPVYEKKRHKFKDIYIFERNITDDTLLYPDWAEDIYLPKCDVVIISGTTLLNKSLDGILEKCKKAHEIAIIGPTTVPAFEIYKQYGITLCATSLVQNADEVLKVAAQGGGGMQILDYIEQVYYR